MQGMGISANKVKGDKRGNKSRLLEALTWPCDSHEEKRKLAHEYVIFYRRGNYLIEGKSSPINRGLILHISFIPKF